MRSSLISFIMFDRLFISKLESFAAELVAVAAADDDDAVLLLVFNLTLSFYPEFYMASPLVSLRTLVTLRAADF